jgi:uncharacterized membrane protein
MATLTVWEFDSATAAEKALNTLQRLQREQLIKLIDGAWVSWPEGSNKPRTQQMHSTAGAGALGGAFWGLLFGLLFFVPLLGMAVGAGLGALTGSMADIGIDDNFIKQVREKVKPGTSALFVLSANEVTDRVADAFKDGQFGKMELIQSNLSREQEDKLRQTFEEPAPAATT